MTNGQVGDYWERLGGEAGHTFVSSKTKYQCQRQVQSIRWTN